MGGAVPKRLLEPVDDLTGTIGGKPIEADGGTGDVATEVFEAVTLMGLTGDSPEGLAEEVGLHPSHLARLFRQQTGTTIGTLRARLQSVDAARRLREGNASLVDIAVDAGFHDQSHFTRQFRRHLGMTPGAHRTMVRGAAQAATGSASAAK